MPDYKFVSNHVEIDPIKRPKKLTATRFAAVMGLNKWASPFATWCEICRVYEDPFTESIYTVAGKIIENKIYHYLNNRFFLDVKSPTDVYGENYFKKTYGDFFSHVDVLGGMWDFIGDDFVVEVKTTKRVEDWATITGCRADGSPIYKVDPPVYYKLQAALYAHLLGFDDVMMVCSFLNEKDYPIELKDASGKVTGYDTTPTEAFVPNVQNTLTYEFKMSEHYPDFENRYITPALDWWRDHVESGISPDFDEKTDEKILKALRKNTLTSDDLPDAQYDALIKEADRLKAEIDRADSKLSDKKDRLKEIDDIIKKMMIAKFRDGDENVEKSGTIYNWNISKSIKSGFDSKRFKADHPKLYEQYSTASTVYTLKKTEIK